MDPRFLETLATLETGNGRKTIKGPSGEDSFNLYNIKDFSGKGYRAVDRAEGSNDAYRVYASADESTADLLGLLSRKYPAALEATNARQFAEALKAGGYATDPEYVQKFERVYDSVAARGDGEPAAVQATPAQQAPRTLEALYAAAAGPRPPKAQMTKTAAAAALVAGVTPLREPSNGAEADWFTRSSVHEQDATKAAAEREQQSLLDISRATFMSTAFGELMKRLTRPEFKPDGTKATEDELRGYTLDEQDAIRQGTSAAERAQIKFEIDDHNQRMLEASKSGPGWHLAGAMIAGLPEAAATGGATSLLLGKLGYSAMQAAKAGQVGRAVGTLAVENVGAGLALTGVQDYLTPYVHMQDYLIGAVADSLGMALFAPSLIRASRGVEHEALAGILDKALESKKADIDMARQELGFEASSEDVAKRAGEMQAARVRDELERHSATLGADRRLVPDDVNEELFGDAPKAEAATADISGWTSVGTSTERAKFPDERPDHFTRYGSMSERDLYSRTSPEWRDTIAAYAEGVTLERVDMMTAGVTVMPAAQKATHLQPAINAVRTLAEAMLPGKRVVIGMMDPASPALLASMAKKGLAGARLNGGVISTSTVHIIGMSPDTVNPTDALSTAVHEVGHAVFHENLDSIPRPLLQRMAAEHRVFLDEMRAGKATARFKRGSEGSTTVLDENGALRGALPDNAYTASFDEYTAEAFTRWVQRRARESGNPLTFDNGVLSLFKAAWEKIKELWTRAREKGYLPADEAFGEFFDRVLHGSLKDADALPTGYLDANLRAPDVSFNVSTASRTDADIMRDYGLDTLAANTPAQRARLKAMVHLYRKAEAYPPIDETRVSYLMTHSPLRWAAPTALTLLTSKNPVARMAAAELLESGAGAGGRRTTASVAKYIYERQFMGNSVNDLQRHYATWRNANGGGLREDYFGGKKWAEFNRRVATELENRMAGRASNEPDSVRNAADVLEAAYERMRVTQQQMKTPGWAALPESSRGYMPHRMSPGKVRDMSPDQGRVLHGVLAEQFEAIAGFDPEFSRALASKYIDIIRKRGTAGYSAPIGVHSAEAADIVEESAAAMGMSRDEANALAKRVMRSQPTHTRHRLQLDLTREYAADGRTFQLLDLFETDQLTLLRSQAMRVSGEAALVRHGIMGGQGLKLLRDALSFGKADGKADNAVLEAFDQVSAEMLGQPFGNQGGKWMNRALQFNAIASLGGMGFNQLAETFNGAVTLGVQHALASVGSLRRLRAEIIALSKGQQVNNPVIGSLETYGAEFGTDHYKLIFPFDDPGRTHEVYGADTLTAADRLLRGGAHLQGKLSLWRAITAAQERGMAEQIVHKALRYIREGKSDKALADMGIDAELTQAMRAELGNTAQFDQRGRLTQFDITKMENREAADAFVQAVHRGTRQIIQGAFIGETGKWAHSGLLKILTQFRTFSLIAIDKQWNRQVGNHGTAAALGILLGTMAFATPIVMVRAGLASLGRPDQDAYLERRLSPASLARETLNYVALSGLAGDLMDAMAAVSGAEPTGGRTGSNKSFMGNVVAPSVGKVNDVWGAIQNNREGTDLHGLVQQLPFARLPWLYPAVNALKPD